MSEQLRVGIIMGSDSDLDTMRHVGRALTELGLKQGVEYEERVISAHRTPEHMSEYAASAEERGLDVIVAGAGGSAHLPGMVASETTVPVLGVAITKRPDVMNRALGSLIGMPEGKPLATFQGKTGAYKAGSFAARVIAARKTTGVYDTEAARVCVLSESDDEAPTMSHVGRALQALGVTHQHHVIGQTLDAIAVASRTQELTDKGLNSIVVSVSGAANLGSVLVSHSTLPILGVAVTKDQDSMNEPLKTIIDSPVTCPIPAFQGEGGAFNAGLFAARLLCGHDTSVRRAYLDYEAGLAEMVLSKDALLSEIGADAYLARE